MEVLRRQPIGKTLSYRLSGTPEDVAAQIHAYTTAAAVESVFLWAAMNPSRPARAPRPASQKALATRQRLIEAAARLFAQHGYEQISVRDVGQELGMTTGAIYRHFRNKAELLEAAVSAAIADQVDNPASTWVTSTYRQAAADLLASHPERQALRALLLDTATAAKSDPTVRERLREVQLERIATWTAVARRDQESGLLNAEAEADTLVKLLWAIEFGLVIFDVFGIAPPEPQATGAAVARMLKPSEAEDTAPPTPARRKAAAAAPSRRSRAK
jgi:AcrR family transcriptional regulator